MKITAPESRLNEKTLIPISMAIILCGGIMWLTTLYNQSAAMANQLMSYERTLHTIDYRLQRIEQKLTIPPVVSE